MESLINLYDYQDGVTNETRKLITQGVKRILIQLPTGGGKTIIFSYIAQNAAAKGNNVLIITDREELLTQAGGTIRKFDINCSYIRAGAKYIDRRKNIFIAMSQTLRNRIQLDEWKKFILEEISLIIIDEAHIQEFNHLFESGLFDKKKVLGFTATPIRSGKQRQLGLDYERLIRGAEPKDLIKKGYLLNCDLYEGDSPDLKGVKVNNITGDYSEQSMFERFDKPKLYQGLLNNYTTKTPGKKMLVFCCNIEHAIKTTIEFNKAGYNAKFVCSEMTPPKLKEDATEAEKSQYNEKERRYQFFRKNYEPYSGPRKEVFDGFKNNNFEILVNVDIATKGFDCPDIEVVAVYRATTSLSLWLQMLGRGSRISEKTGKTHFTVFDFGGNKKRLGNYDDNRNWSLWHDTKKVSGVPPLKECGINSSGKAIKSANHIEKGCKRLILASYTMCPFCGFKYPEKKEGAEADLILAKILDENGVSIKSKSFSNMDWKELTKYREIKGHKQPWLWRQLWHRGKKKELEDYAAEYRWSKLITDKAINYCENNLT